MFLRATIRKKDGKEHRYWSLVENKRVRGGRVMQRHVLYLGEINSSQELAWRKSIEVLEDGTNRPRTLALFPEDRCEGVLPDASVVRLRLSQVWLSRPRQWGACWLAVKLWEELQLDRFWAERLPASRKGTRWDQVLLVLTAYRLIAPGIANGTAAARLRICLARTPRWPTATRFIAAMTACWSTSRPCSISWWAAGAIYSTSPSMCCCTI